MQHFHFDARTYRDDDKQHRKNNKSFHDNLNLNNLLPEMKIVCITQKYCRFQLVVGEG